MDDISEHSSSDDCRPPPPKKGKVYKQKYNCQWEKDPELKGWLAPVKKDPLKAYCKVCKKELVAGLSELKKHQSTKKHKENTNVRTTTRPITAMIATDNTLEQVKRAEIKSSAFLVEHNLPFKVMDHFSDLVSDMFPDSTIAKKFSSKHTKARSIVKHVIANDFRAILLETLRTTRFSIIIDETTDVSSRKLLAIVVRYFSEVESTIKSQFLTLVQPDGSDADSLVSCLVSYFESADIPIHNMIGYASDTTNVMFGEHHSVVSLLKAKVPHLFAMKCLCHSAHLCASHACEKLPRAIEDLIRDIYLRFAHSAKRLAEYRRFQDFTGVEPHKLLRVSQTRWLSLEQCVQRVLEQWQALEAYFTEAAEKDRLVMPTTILMALKNPIFKLYYHFLSFVLPKFTRFNKLFQSESPNIHFLTSYLTSTYKGFLSCYLSPVYLRSTSVDKIDPENASHFVPLTSMSMGAEVSKILATPSIAQMRTEILSFQHVQLFYVEAAKQIKNRFPIDDPILKSLIILNPGTMNSTSAVDVINVAQKFPNIIAEESIQALDDEWRELQFLQSDDLPQSSNSSGYDVVSFWARINSMRDTSGNKRFDTVSNLMLSLLSLPHSNAEVERVFSQVNLIKTKQRNCLKPKTLDAVLMTKQGMSSSCVDFKPTKTMYRRMNNVCL